MWPFKRKQEDTVIDEPKPHPYNVDRANKLFEMIGSDYRVRHGEGLSLDQWEPVFKAIADLQAQLKQPPN